MSKAAKGVVKEFFFYPNKQDSQRRVTIAGVLTKDNKIQVGKSTQRPGEPFNKVVGRGISLGRAISNPIFKVPVTQEEGVTPADQFIELAKQVDISQL